MANGKIPGGSLSVLYLLSILWIISTPLMKYAQCHGMSSSIVALGSVTTCLTTRRANMTKTITALPYTQIAHRRVHYGLH